jgi:Protein of unknown function (DUF3128)
MSEAAASGADSAGKPDGIVTGKSGHVPVSCTKAFDALYYCYSPVYQGKVYYQTGELDDCRGRLRRFRMCVMSRFRPEEESAKLYDAVAQEEAKDSSPPVWELREEYVRRVQSMEEADRRSVREGGGEAPSDSKDGWWL